MNFNLRKIIKIKNKIKAGLSLYLTFIIIFIIKI